MNNDQFVRYKALDRCFRVNPAIYDMEGLIEACTKAVRAHHGNPDFVVSRSTVEHDLTDLKLRYDIKLCSNLRLGRKKLYQYEDTSFSLMNKLLADGVLEQMMLQNVLDTLSLYDDIPQYKWLRIFLQQQMNSKKTEGTNAISFQNNPDLLGMEHFDFLLDAILQHQPVRLEYKPYNKDAYYSDIHPYLLKQFNDRWFLIARTEGYDSLTNFGIDRIQSVQRLDIPFCPVGFNLDEYFADFIGVSRSVDKPIEDIFIRISNSRFDYIKTKPIHDTQKEIHAMKDENSHVIKLQLQVNRELEAKILSLGNDAEVLEPESLRDIIKSKIEDLFKKYSNSANELRE